MTDERYNSEYEEIDLREYIAILWKRKRMILSILVLSILISGIISYFILTPVYESKLTVQLDFEKGLGYNAKVVANLVTSLDYLEELNQHFDLGMSTSELLKFSDKISTNKLTNELLDLRINGEDPKLNKEFLDYLVGLLEEDIRVGLEQKVRNYNDNLVEVEEEIAILEEEVKQHQHSVDSILSNEEFSVAEKTILANHFNDKIQKSKGLKLQLMDKKYEIKSKLNDIGELDVINPAIVPEDPIKPNKKLNIAIAAVLGLMLGVFLAFILEFFKDFNLDDYLE